MKSNRTKLAYEVGKRIRNARLDHRLSQDAVAARVGVSIAAVSKIETGLTDMSLSRLHQIADALDIDVAALFTDEGIVEDVEVSEVSIAMKKITLLNEEIAMLQRKMIAIYRELHEGRSKTT